MTMTTTYSKTLFPPAAMSVSPGYSYRKQLKENGTKVTAKLYNSPPTNCIHPAMWSFSDSSACLFTGPLKVGTHTPSLNSKTCSLTNWGGNNVLSQFQPSLCHLSLFRLPCVNVSSPCHSSKFYPNQAFLCWQLNLSFYRRLDCWTLLGSKLLGFSPLF